MALLICCPSPQELSALAPALFPVPAHIPEMQPIAAKLGGADAIFLVSGVGPLNAALAVAYAEGLLRESKEIKITGILCVGTAHSFNLDAAPLLSTWLVEKEIWPEYGLNDGMRVTARAFSTPLWKRKEQEDIFETVELASLDDIGISPKAKAREWPKCAAITVAGATASFDRRESLWNYWRAPLENMEGFAIAYAALRALTPCVEIRIVGAKAGPRSKDEKDIEGALAKIGTVLSDLKLV